MCGGREREERETVVTNLHEFHRLDGHLSKPVGVAVEQNVPEIVVLTHAPQHIGQLGIIDEPAHAHA